MVFRIINRLNKYASSVIYIGGRHDCMYMVVGFTTACAISAYDL
jgi:hypothetical protein